MNMKKIKGITLKLVSNEPGQVEVDFGNGYSEFLSEADLLNPDPTTQLVANLGTAFKVGGYATPRSKEFLNGVNTPTGQDGFETSIGKLRINAIKDAEPGRLVISFYGKAKDSTMDVEVLEADLSGVGGEAERYKAVVANIGVCLKLLGKTTIDADAIAKVRDREFWW